MDTHGLAKGEVKGVDGMNQAIWRMGGLKHQPPRFKYFDPGLEEQRAVVYKEIKLPRAEQTHSRPHRAGTRRQRPSPRRRTRRAPSPRSSPRPLR